MGALVEGLLTKEIPCKTFPSMFAIINFNISQANPGLHACVGDPIHMHEAVLPLLIFIYPKFNDQKSVVCNHKLSGEIRAQKLLAVLLLSRQQRMKNAPQLTTLRLRGPNIYGKMTGGWALWPSLSEESLSSYCSLSCKPALELEPAADAVIAAQ